MAGTLPKKIAFRREQTGDPGLDRMQRMAQQLAVAHEQTKAVVATMPFVNGVLVKSQVIGLVDTTVTHNLGRVPVGYICTRRQGNASSWCESLPANQPADKTKQYAFIAAGAPVTLDLYFF